jgi:hypothetical protein
MSGIREFFSPYKPPASDGGLAKGVGSILNKPQPEAPKLKDEAKVIKLGVVVGHDRAAPGAQFCEPYRGIYEYNFNTEIAHLMQEYAHSRGVELDVFYRDKVGIGGVYKQLRASECVVVVELHCNAYDGTAYGTETLCSSNNDDKHLATTIQNAICALFGRSGKGDRGIKITDSGRGAESCTSFPGKANCLVEPGFCDNKQDAAALMSFKRPYAHALVDAMVSVVEPVKSQPKQSSGEIPILSWEVNHPERKKWSETLWRLIGEHYDSFDKAKDTSYFAPNIANMTRVEKMRAWAEIIIAICFYECGWNPASAGKDVGPDEYNYWSVGLLQLSQVDQKNYGFQFGFTWEDLKDPHKNLKLGLAILARQFDKRGVWLIKKGEVGVYWAVIHPGGKYDKSESIRGRVQKALLQ